MSDEVSLLEYIWIGGNNELRSKTRVEYKKILYIKDIPIWNYDGSSTNQLTNQSKDLSKHNTEILLKPVKFIKDPLRKGEFNYIVLCETYSSDGIPIFNNHRCLANKIFSQKQFLEPWYGLEQEYVMENIIEKWPDINVQ